MSDPVFFRPVRAFTVKEIAALTGAKLVQPELAETAVQSVAPIAEACAGALIYAQKRKYLDELGGRQAAAILCLPELSGLVPAGIAVLETPYPQLAFVMAGQALFPKAVAPAAITGLEGVSDHATVLPGAVLEADVTVEASAVISPGVTIGSGTVIGAGAVIGANVQIGRKCMIGPGATVQNSLIGDRVMIHAGARLGQDGFGYAPSPMGPLKIPQIGRVVVQNDVEIGANSTIDRGMIADTVIGEATKIDNLVQIGHNVQIGRYCMIAGCCGIAGSVRIEDFVMLGGSVGVGDHITIGRGARVAGGTGVTADIPAKAVYGGYPAMPAKEWLRNVATLRRMTKTRSRKETDD